MKAIHYLCFEETCGYACSLVKYIHLNYLYLYSTERKLLISTFLKNVSCIFVINELNTQVFSMCISALQCYLP